MSSRVRAGAPTAVPHARQRSPRVRASGSSLPSFLCSSILTVFFRSDSPFSSTLVPFGIQDELDAGRLRLRTLAAIPFLALALQGRPLSFFRQRPCSNTSLRLLRRAQLASSRRTGGFCEGRRANEAEELPPRSLLGSFFFLQSDPLVKMSSQCLRALEVGPTNRPVAVVAHSKFDSSCVADLSHAIWAWRSLTLAVRTSQSPVPPCLSPRRTNHRTAQ